MPDWPLVSLVTPVLNGAELLQRTIDSIRQQDYPHIEHVVMDGGSIDGTLDILRANEAHLKWFSEPDSGQSDAINKAFARTAGQYMNWLNADDFFYPHAIRRIVEAFNTTPKPGIVYGRLALVNKDGSLRKIDPSAFFPRGVAKLWPAFGNGPLRDGLGPLDQDRREVPDPLHPGDSGRACRL